jgi:hypothetical protein
MPKLRSRNKHRWRESRLRGKLGEGSHWQDYKAVRLHESYYGAFYQDNEALITI